MFESYTINPKILFGSLGWKDLHSVSRYVYKECLDYAWLGSNVYYFHDNEALWSYLNLSGEKTGRALNSLSSPGQELLVKGFIDREEVFIVPALEQQYREWEAEIESKKKNASARNERKSRIKDSTLSGLYSSRDVPVMHSLGVIPQGERATTEYCGWFPTSSFASRGQAYMVTAPMKENFEAKYVNIDVNHELREIFGWLNKNKHRRRSFSKTGDMVHTWLDSANTSLDDSEESSFHKSMSDVSLDLDRIFGGPNV